MFREVIHIHIQGWFWAWAHHYFVLTVTLWWLLSLAECKPRISPAYALSTAFIIVCGVRQKREVSMASNILWKQFLLAPVFASYSCLLLHDLSQYNNSQLAMSRLSIIDGIVWQPFKLQKHSYPYKTTIFMFPLCRIEMEITKWHPLIFWPNSDVYFFHLGRN